MVLLVSAVALPMRTGWPARHPSPKKSPGPSIATTASLPVLESTDSFTPPFWMYRTLSHGSPCVKIVSDRQYSTILLATPAESRNASTLNAPLCLDSMARPPCKHSNQRMTTSTARTDRGLLRPPDVAPLSDRYRHLPGASFGNLLLNDYADEPSAHAGSKHSRRQCRN